MAKITYRVREFIRPPKLTLEQYLFFKQRIHQDPSFKIDSEINSFKNEFNKEFKFLVYSFIYLSIFITLLEIFYDGGHDKSLDFFRIIITIPAIIAGLGSFFVIVILILEGPHFAKYLRDKREYFETMQLSINRSKDYPDFCKSFYYFYEV